MATSDTNISNLIINQMTESELSALQTAGTVPANQVFVTEDATTSLPYSHVGQVIMTTSTTFDPAQVYGGTWEQLTADAYLKIATGNAIGTLNGTASDHKIPLSSMPSHNHTVYTFPYGGSESGYYCVSSNPGGNVNPDIAWGGGYTNSVGGGQAYYPYYYGVKVWRRTA